MNTNKDFLKSAIYFGLLMAGAFVLIDLLFYVFDLSGMGMLFGFLVLLIIIALYFIFFIWGGRSYRNKFMGGYMKFGKAFLFCLIMAGIYAIVMLAYNSLFYFLFDPQRAVYEMEKAVEMIQDNSYIPDDQKEGQIRRIMDNTTASSIVIRNVISNLVTGVILGAISALFIRRKEKISEVF